jgi:hypothetical protein
MRSAWLLLCMLAGAWSLGTAAAAEPGPIERMEIDGRADPDRVADELERLLSSDAIKGMPRLEAATCWALCGRSCNSRLPPRRLPRP